MKATAQGRLAEIAVAELLKRQTHTVVAMNWRRPRCEIDVITKRHKIIYFVEVKYRAQAAQGGGFEHITPGKLRQMETAARLWVAENNWDGDWRLMAADVSGPACERIGLMEL